MRPGGAPTMLPPLTRTPTLKRLKIMTVTKWAGGEVISATVGRRGMDAAADIKDSDGTGVAGEGRGGGGDREAMVKWATGSANTKRDLLTTPRKG